MSRKPTPRKRTTQTTVVEEPEIEGLEVTEEKPEDIQSEDLSEFLKAYGADGLSFKVFKVNDRGKERYCFQAYEELDEDIIQRGYGGGRYRVRVFENGIYKTTVTVEIEESIAPIESGAMPMHGARDPVSEMQIRMMEKQMENQNALLQTILSNGMNGGGNSSSLTELANVIQVLGLNQKPDTPIDTAMGLITKGMELANNASGDTDWKKELLGLAKDVVPGVASAFKAKEPPPANQIEETNPNDMMRAGIAYLKKKVLEGMPVGLALDWITQNANDVQYQDFIRHAVSTDFGTFAAQLDPELSNEPYATWFKSLHAGLKEAYDQTSRDEDSTGSAGYPSNTGTDG